MSLEVVKNNYLLYYMTSAQSQQFITLSIYVLKYLFIYLLMNFSLLLRLGALVAQFYMCLGSCPQCLSYSQSTAITVGAQPPFFVICTAWPKEKSHTLIIPGPPFALITAHIGHVIILQSICNNTTFVLIKSCIYFLLRCCIDDIRLLHKVFFSIKIFSGVWTVGQLKPVPMYNEINR